MSEDKVALVEALSKLSLGALLAGILSAVIWFNHSEQLFMHEIMGQSITTTERIFSNMEKNQEIYLEVFNKHAKQMEETGIVLRKLANESK